MTKYAISSRIFHWSSALLILSLFALGLWMRSLGYYDAWYQDAPDLHKSFGLLLALIIILRVLNRFFKHPPAALDTHKLWETKLAHIIHGILYLGLFIIIISGYFIATSDNRGIEVFDLFSFPAFFTAFEEQEDIAGFIHEWAAYILMALVSLHVAGALKHHFLDKDSTLKRML